MNNKDGQIRSAELKLREMIGGGWIGWCIYVAVKWDLITQFERNESLTSICDRLGWRHDRFLRFVKALESIGLVIDRGDDRFALTDLGKLLLPSPAGGVEDMAILHGEEFFLSWARLPDILASDVSAFELRHGLGFYPYARTNPEFGRRFERAMRGIAEVSHAEIPQVCPWRTVKHVIDVGGGNGFLLTRLLKTFPHLSGTLYDQPEVVSAAERLIAGENSELRNRMEFVGGDFFKLVPKGGDCILLSHILHNFDDARALQILQNCTEVLPSTGKLRLVEQTLRPDEVSTRSRYMDLQMMILHGGRERTVDELKSLLDRVGLKIVQKYDLKNFSCLIEGQRRNGTDNS
jgi:SAM-dependent methyltransferase